MKRKSVNDSSLLGQIDSARFLNPLIIDLEQVGSRAMETELDGRKAQGGDVIPVYGYPVVPPPVHVEQAIRESAGSTFSPPSHGLLELRERLADSIEIQYGARVDPEKELLVSCGAMNALHIAMTALLQPDDEVLIVAPCYFFGGLVRITGARPEYAEMNENDGYALDFQEIRKKISSRTKAIILSSPVNPTGYIYTRSDVEKFIALAEEHNLLLVSDESYDRLVYDGRPHVSPMSYPEGRARTILVKSFTKSYALPMLRVGYMAADPVLISSFRKVLEWTVLHNAYVNQKAALAALVGPQDWLLGIFQDFQDRRNQLVEGIRNIEAFSCNTPLGGPFIFLNVSQRSPDCDEFARHLLLHYGIPTVGGRYFQARNHVRIPFGGTQAAVAQLIDALAHAGNSDSEQ